MVMPKDKSRGLLAWQPLTRRAERRSLCRSRGIRARLRRTEPSDDFADLPQALLTSVRDRDVDGNTMNPRLRRGGRLPPRPGVESTHKRLLSAVFGRSAIVEDAGQRVENPVIALAIQLVEVLANAGAIRLVKYCVPGPRSCRPGGDPFIA
jgi:hypothetical protein